MTSQSEYLHEEVQRLERQVRERDEEIVRYREREADIAKMLQVADGGQYRADWEAPIRRLAGERNSLRAFAQGALDALSEMGWTDEEAIHKLGVEHGLLVIAEVSGPCDEDCPCSEWGEFPTTCHRRTELLTGKEG